MQKIIITVVSSIVETTTITVVDAEGKDVAETTATPAELKKPAPPLFKRNPVTGALEFTGKGDGTSELEKLLGLNQAKGLVGKPGYEKPGDGSIQAKGLVGARGYEKPGPLQDVGGGNLFDFAKGGYGENPQPCPHCGGYHD